MQSGLSRIIETEILPRLTYAYCGRGETREVPEAPNLGRAATLVQALMNGPVSEAHVRMLLDDGLPLDALLLDLLATAACHLGWLWDEDEADLVEVTVALGRLHHLARTLCTRLEVVGSSANRHRILLIPCPGELHFFNLTIIASIFREAGWFVILSGNGDEDPTALVRNERFDLIGASLSCDVLLPRMVDLIARLRAASCNPTIRVLVGGPFFHRHPTFVANVGADAAAGNGRCVVAAAEALLTR